MINMIIITKKTATSSDRIKKVLSLFDPIINGKILDIGCGDGYLSVLICEKTQANLYGCDISENGLRAAKKRGIIVKKVDISSGALPYPDNYFDAIFCGEFIEHIFDTDNFAEEMKRIIKKDGYIILTTPNLASWFNRILMILGYQPYGYEISTIKLFGGLCLYDSNVKPSGHIRVFALSAIKECFKFHGYVIEKNIGNDISYGNSIINLLNKTFSLRWTTGSRNNFKIKN
ncbi:Ubiquinone biosynthesis O-methyltransferase [uncultured archaeon]|nr:Ubiquinone biosynthesis O-methyltransferase [uncultured archaeon]